MSRLVGRAWQGRQLTGVDRVAAAYASHSFQQGHADTPRATRATRALLRWRGLRRVLTPRASRQLHQLLQPAEHHGTAALRRALVHLLSWPGHFEPDTCLRGSTVIYPTHTGLEHPGLAPWVRRTQQQALFFLHDLIPLTHPEYCRAGTPAAHALRLAHMAQCGSGIIVNSMATQHELQAHAQDRGWSLPPVLVAPLAAGPWGASESSAGQDTPSPLAAPYFVVLGTIEARKNHLLLLQVWRELVARYGDDAPHLIVIGQRGWECEQVLDMLDRCERIRTHVKEVSACPDAQVRAYLRHARALLFPSFAEGFGLPLVEALQLGTPVIASPLDVFKEVAGQVPDYVDPLDGVGWMQRIEAYTPAASTARAAQLQRMQTFVPPSWTAHFEAVQAFVQRLHGGAGVGL